MTTMTTTMPRDRTEEAYSLAKDIVEGCIKTALQVTNLPDADKYLDRANKAIESFIEKYSPNGQYTERIDSLNIQIRESRINLASKLKLGAQR